MYSMVNLAALVRDVARHPRAAALADDLLRVLALDEAALADLERVRWNALAQATRRVEVAEVTDALPSWSRGDVETTNNGTLAVEVLERTPMSTAGDLTRFVRRELLAFAWRS
jgi:hypothetical protein